MRHHFAPIEPQRTMPALWDWVLVLLLIAAATIAFFPALNGTPIWDDDAHLTRPELRSLEGLGRIWAQPGATQQFYPLVHTVFWFEHAIWGDSPFWYHVINLLMHCASALLLVAILRRLEIPGAWLATMIFALHPIQTETVAWISELKNVVSGLFYFGSILVYLRFYETRRLSFYWVSLVLFAAGLMSKSVIATMPATLLVIFWWKQGRLSLKQDILPLVPFFVAGASFGLFTAWVEERLIGAQGSAYNSTLIERGLIAGRVIWFYLAKLFWPAELIFVYPRWRIDQTVWWQYLFPAGVLALLAVAVWLSRRWRAPLAGLLIFIGTLFPVLGFLNVYPFRYSLVADHFAYLAILGVIVPVSAGLTMFFERYAWPQIRYIPAVLLVVLLVALTARQSAMYTDIETLWQTTIERNPAAWMAHNNLGAFLLGKGNVEDAISHFRKAAEINANDAETQGNLGDALLRLNQIDEAIAHYQTALQIKPDYPEVHYNLANALLADGNITDAIAHYETALRGKPNDADIHNNLGIALLEQGQVDEAIKQYHEALEIDPKNIRAEANLAWALATSGENPVLRGAIAVRLAEQASDQSGGANPAILRVLAASYAQAGRFTQAVDSAQRALDLALGQKNAGLANSLENEIEFYRVNMPYRIVSP